MTVLLDGLPPVRCYSIATHMKRARRVRDSIADLFHAGRYQEVLARTVDHPRMAYNDEDASFVVGALAFAGRVTEAEACLDAFARHLAEADLVSGLFFLGVAHARAGRIDEARRCFLANVTKRRALGPCGRFYVYQGLACLRYFTGSMRAAERLARAALSAAYGARFPYGRLLATDLRGHALVLLGALSPGLFALEQAKALAETLGLHANASAIACAIDVYHARYGGRPLAQSIAALEARARSLEAEDSYSLAMIDTELAYAYAFAGRVDESWCRLERLAVTSAADPDRRKRARILVACATVAVLRTGPASAGVYLDEAKRAADRVHDAQLAVDLALVGVLTGETSALLQLERLYETTGMVRARFFECLREVASVDASLRDEGRTLSLLARAWRRDPCVLTELTQEGYLGLVPLALGLGAGRALVVLRHEQLLLIERGQVCLVHIKDGSLRLLRGLRGETYRSKEDLVKSVWHLGVYKPTRHDPVIHTALSRLRATLGTCAHWIDMRGSEYRLSPDVSWIEVENVFDQGAAVDATRADDNAIERALGQAPRSTSEIASLLGMSEMTTFRRLRDLVDEGLVIRVGKGRATRYTLRAPAGAEGAS